MFSTIVLSTAAIISTMTWSPTQFVAFDSGAKDYLNVHVAAYHYGNECNGGCRGFTPGLGFERRWGDRTVEAGILRNSIGKVSTYVGEGWFYRVGERIQLSAGAVVGLMYYGGAQFNPIPFVLPAFAIGPPDGTQISAAFIPPVQDTTVAAWFFSIQWRLR